MIYFNLKTPAKKFKKKQFILTLNSKPKNPRKNSNRKFQFEQFTLIISASQTSTTGKRNQKQTIFYLVNPAAVAVSIFDATVEFLLFAID